MHPLSQRNYYELLSVGLEAGSRLSGAPTADWRSCIIPTAIQANPARLTTSERFRRSVPTRTASGIPCCQGAACGFHPEAFQGFRRHVGIFLFRQPIRQRKRRAAAQPRPCGDHVPLPAAEARFCIRIVSFPCGAHVAPAAAPGRSSAPLRPMPGRATSRCNSGGLRTTARECRSTRFTVALMPRV